MARPFKEINWEHFEQLAALQCTQSEIASFLHIHPNTLSDRAKDHYGEDYSSVYKKYAEGGKCSLRRNQFMLSKKNASMAIWLGKMWLGQRDYVSDDANKFAEELLHAIREIQKQPGNETSQRSEVASQQSLLDKGPAGEKNQIPDELGPARAL